MKNLASIAWTSALVSTLLIGAGRVNAAESEKPSSPHLRRRAESGNGTSGWTSPPDDVRSGNSTAGEPLYRVWVEFKPSATHSAALKSVQSTIVANLGAPPDVAAKMLVAERDSEGSDAKSSSQKYAFTMHYDFYDMDVQSMVMTMSSKALRAMRKDPNVLRVEMDPKRFAFDAINGERNHEENRRLQEQIRQQGEVVPTGVVMTKANQVWAKGYTGRGVKVCVIDSGLDGTHKEFPISSWVGFSTNVGSWWYDYNGHGTHVTGTIAARRNGFGVAGVAPDSTILTFRAMGSDGSWAYASTLADAAQSCYKAGAKVINMSLGGPDYSTAENNMFKSLYSKGVVSVAAAGNDGGTKRMYPAAYVEVVSVAAVTSQKRVASFSQRNDRVDLSAHGVGVVSTAPLWAGGYASLDGTSMACPHVAGVAALLFSKKPSASASAIVSAMTSTAQDLGTAGRDNSYGFGLVDALAALSRV